MKINSVSLIINNNRILMKGKQSHDMMAKLIIIGDSGVGKTNIILNFVGDPFKSSYVATIGVDFKAKTLELAGKRIKLQIWDTAGQERYRTITQTYYKGASGIILAYSLIDRQSFQNLNSWMLQIRQKAPHGVPKLVIGNKKDLADQSRTVTTEEGIKLADKFSTQDNKIMFMQVSAKTGEGVQQAFLQISQQVAKEYSDNHITKPAIRLLEGSHLGDQPHSNCHC